MSKIFIVIVLLIATLTACSSSSKEKKNEEKVIEPIKVKISLEESPTAKDAVDIYAEFKRGKESNKRKLGTTNKLKTGEYFVEFTDMVVKADLNEDGKMEIVPSVLEKRNLSFAKHPSKEMDENGFIKMHDILMNPIMFMCNTHKTKVIKAQRDIVMFFGIEYEECSQKDWDKYQKSLIGITVSDPALLY